MTSKINLYPMRKAALGIILVIFTINAAAQGTVTAYRTETGISYRPESTDAYTAEQCKLDIYYPADAKGFPTVIWFHGGGLTGGKRHIPEGLMEKGFAVVGVGYRLASKVSVSEIIRDAARAAVWTLNNIGRYGGDPSGIYLAGHSAGGYLVSMIGLDKRWLEPYGVDPDDSFAAIIPYSGQSIVHFEDRKAKGIPITQPLVDDMAPMYHVRPDCAPILIISGDREMEMNGRYEENAFFWRLLRVTGHPDARILELDGFNHSEMAQPGHMAAVKYIREKEKARVKHAAAVSPR